MIFLKNDYSLGAHPQVFQALADQNLTPSDSYSNDTFCTETTQLVRQITGQPDADMHFIAGGTLTNLV